MRTKKNRNGYLILVCGSSQYVVPTSQLTSHWAPTARRATKLLKGNDMVPRLGVGVGVGVGDIGIVSAQGARRWRDFIVIEGMDC